jgi:hypothetical protein
MGLARQLDPGKDLERDAAKRVASMIDTARRGWQELVMLGWLLACETAHIPPSEAVLPATDERSAAGAAASLPSSGGAYPEPNRGLGGNTADTGASGTGGNGTGSGGTAGDGASGGSAGASGRDDDPSKGDEVRYALWLGPAAD